MKWMTIPQTGELARPVLNSEFLQSGIEATQAWYRQAGFQPPWVGYLVWEDETPVGFCAFKTAPQAGRVEIAYATVPGFENRGVATAMARRLLEIAAKTDPEVVVFAQTLPGENASTAILEKLGFERTATLEHPEDGTIWEWTRQPNRLSP